MSEQRLDAQAAAQLRNLARRRSLIVPGAGLFLLGYRGAGLMIGLPLAVAIASLGWLALAPSPPLLWTFLISAAAALCGSFVESLALRRIPPRLRSGAGSLPAAARTSPDKKTASKRGFTFLWLVLALGVLLDGWLIFRYVGWFKLQDAGMDPSASPGDFLLFSRFAADGSLSRGAVVAYRTPEDSPVESENGLAIGRIVAVPDDELSLSADGRRYVVNGDDTGLLAAHLGGDTLFDVPRSPQTVKIAFKSYFIAADNPRLGYDSRTFGLVAKERIISARLLRFGRGAFGMAISEPARAASPATPTPRPAHNRQQPPTSDAASPVDAAISAATKFLRERQADDGAWRSETYGSFKDGASLTPLLALALAEAEPRAKAANGRSSNPSDAVLRAARYLAGLIERHGGARQAAESSTYPVYTTALAVALLSRPEFAGEKQLLAARDAWLAHLRALQLAEDLGWSPDDEFYGGWGYSTDMPKKPVAAQPPRQLDEPNLSATLFALTALRAAGAKDDDPALAKARRFVERCQNFADGPEQAKDAPHLDGGFFFILRDADRNKAGLAAPPGDAEAEGADAENTAARASASYRSYGSATADGLGGLILCGSPPDDPRCKAALEWLAARFDAKQQAGDFAADKLNWRDALYFYSMHSLAQALATWESQGRDVPNPLKEWRADLAAALVARQRPDGSWANSLNENREDDPLLASALALRTLAVCRDPKGVELRP